MRILGKKLLMWIKYNMGWFMNKIILVICIGLIAVVGFEFNTIQPLKKEISALKSENIVSDTETNTNSLNLNNNDIHSDEYILSNSENINTYLNKYDNMPLNMETFKNESLSNDIIVNDNLTSIQEPEEELLSLQITEKLENIKINVSQNFADVVNTGGADVISRVDAIINSSDVDDTSLAYNDYVTRAINDIQNNRIDFKLGDSKCNVEGCYFELSHLEDFDSVRFSKQLQSLKISNPKAILTITNEDDKTHELTTLLLIN